jgi:hypothetical protein
MADNEGTPEDRITGNEDQTTSLEAQTTGWHSIVYANNLIKIHCIGLSSQLALHSVC